MNKNARTLITLTAALWFAAFGRVSAEIVEATAALPSYKAAATAITEAQVSIETAEMTYDEIDGQQADLAKEIQKGLTPALVEKEAGLRRQAIQMARQLARDNAKLAGSHRQAVKSLEGDDSVSAAIGQAKAGIKEAEVELGNTEVEIAVDGRVDQLASLAGVELSEEQAAAFETLAQEERELRFEINGYTQELAKLRNEEVRTRTLIRRHRAHARRAEIRGRRYELLAKSLAAGFGPGLISACLTDGSCAGSQRKGPDPLARSRQQKGSDAVASNPAQVRRELWRRSWRGQQP